MYLRLDIINETVKVRIFLLQVKIFPSKVTFLPTVVAVEFGILPS